MEHIALAIAPGIAICLFIFFKDVYNREPRFNLIVSFLLGCLAILPAIGFEKSFSSVVDGTVNGLAIFAYAVVAFSEEMSKFLGLRLYSYNQKEFDEPLDGIVYSLMVSIGFATAENIEYVVEHQALAGNGMEVAIQRLFTAVPAHASFAIVMGYFAGKAKFNPGNSVGLLVMGLLGAIFLHGTYDFFIFLDIYSHVGEELGKGLLTGGAIFSMVLSLILCRKLIREHRNTSAKMFADKKTDANV
jgi:RsiW-degrading membrane proteinase PrsW (M82 family)